jgi:nucleoside-diphosphate-sugar epimerase
LFCFGFGYSARHLAKRLRGEGWRIGGSARSAAKIEAMRADGIDAYQFDGDRDLPDRALDGFTHIVSSVPPEPEGDPVLLRCRDSIVARAGSLRWLGYLSTTGIYGDHQGGWVDENTPPAPTSERSRRRVAAEDAWLDLHRARGLPVHVFRLAGIYGPGRNILADVRAGTARRIIKPGHRFGRIHVEDIARVLIASMAKPNPGAIYNLADDEPAAPAAVVEFAAGLLGVSPPPEIPFAAATMSPMAASFWADNRQVRNDRIKRELGVALEYPTYREGLTALALKDR